MRYRRFPDFSRILGLMASIQFMGALSFTLCSLLGISASTVYDSARAASHLGVSVFIASIPGSATIITTWTLFIGSIEAEKRIRAFWSIIIGALFGFLIWLTVIGPIILPD
jgi:hypothetical protein